MTRILVIEDDLDMSGIVRDYFETVLDYRVECVFDGKAGLDKLLANSYDAIVVDWGLPEMDGTDVCKEYRVRGGLTPILMLTGRDLATDMVTGLECGADDYLIKPFKLQELGARIKALIRRDKANS